MGPASCTLPERMRFVTTAASALLSAAFLYAAPADGTKLTSAERVALLRRAQVWQPTDIPAVDIKRGPDEPGAFSPNEVVVCDYIDRKLTGKSPKFECKLESGDEVKVKHGRENGEVYGEVAATRLLWALGFGADRMYPVRVICHGCPANVGGFPDPGGRMFDVAAIERKMPGHDLDGRDIQGWKWIELDFPTPADHGAPKAHRDALKLLAALLQHTDNKAVQQRLICLDTVKKGSEAACEHPLMMVNDLGLTFGRANEFNENALGSVNFERWSKTPVWKDDKSCVAELRGSATGTLEYPVISEEGRAFLAGLLAQLTDAQLHDLFEVARFDRRSRAPHEEGKAPASIDEWIAAFKQKRDQIVDRHCPA